METKNLLVIHNGSVVDRIAEEGHPSAITLEIDPGLHFTATSPNGRISIMGDPEHKESAPECIAIISLGSLEPNTTRVDREHCWGGTVVDDNGNAHPMDTGNPCACKTVLDGIAIETVGIGMVDDADRGTNRWHDNGGIGLHNVAACFIDPKADNKGNTHTRDDRIGVIARPEFDGKVPHPGH